MTIMTRAFSVPIQSLAALLGLLCLLITARIPPSTVMSEVSVTLSLGAAPSGERAPFVISGIDALNKNDVRLVVLEGQAIDSRVERSVILHSSDGGTTWKRQLVTEGRTDYHHSLTSVHFISTSLGWAAGYNGIILRTTDGGVSWNQQRSPTEAILSEIQFVDNNWGWILAEEGGEILHTEDGGTNWRSYSFNATGRLTSLSFRDKLQGWVVGESGQVLETTDSGKSWVSRGRDLSAKVSARGQQDIVFSRVKFITRDVGFIAAGFNYNWPKYRPNGIILETTNGGRTWQPIVASESLGLTYADFVTNKNMWVVLGDYREERLLHTTDEGKNWAFVRATSKTRTVQFVDANHGWLIAGLWDYPITDHLLRTNDGGLTWSEVKLPKWTEHN